jgi:hypothetical protein
MEKMPITGRYMAFSDLAPYVDGKVQEAVAAEKERVDNLLSECRKALKEKQGYVCDCGAWGIIDAAVRAAQEKEGKP